MRGQPGRCHRGRHAVERIEDRIVLAPEGQRAVGVMAQPDECLAAEQPAALLQLAVVNGKAAFQHEEGPGAAAEVLDAAQAPPVVLHGAGQHLCGRVPAFVVDIGHADGQQSVQRHRVLRAHRATQAKRAAGA
ncbi:hypothetical protein D3C81_1262520 [compost metagenome]